MQCSDLLVALVTYTDILKSWPLKSEKHTALDDASIIWYAYLTAVLSNSSKVLTLRKRLQLKHAKVPIRKRRIFLLNCFWPSTIYHNTMLARQIGRFDSSFPSLCSPVTLRNLLDTIPNHGKISGGEIPYHHHTN